MRLLQFLVLVILIVFVVWGFFPASPLGSLGVGFIMLISAFQACFGNRETKNKHHYR